MSMSESSSSSSDSSTADDRTRQPAKRVFASELTDATFSFAESDADNAPEFVLLPTGEKANRVIVEGVITEADDIGEDSEYYRARLVDGSSGINVYAGQYQPDAAAFFRELDADADLPKHVVVVGKPRVYDPDDSDEKYVSIRPEIAAPSSPESHERWITNVAHDTADRLENFTAGNEYATLAVDKYGPAEDLEFTAYRNSAAEAFDDNLIEDDFMFDPLTAADCDASFASASGSADDGDSASDTDDDAEDDDADGDTDSSADAEDGDTPDEDEPDGDTGN